VGGATSGFARGPSSRAPPLGANGGAPPPGLRAGHSSHVAFVRERRRAKKGEPIPVSARAHVYLLLLRTNRSERRKRVGGEPATPVRPRALFAGKRGRGGSKKGGGLKGGGARPSLPRGYPFTRAPLRAVGGGNGGPHPPTFASAFLRGGGRRKGLQRFQTWAPDPTGSTRAILGLGRKRRR